MKSICLLAWMMTLTAAYAAAAELPEALKPCPAIRRDAERLACFDRAVAAIETGETAATSTSPESLFGSNADVTQSSAKSDSKHDELKQISGSVAYAHRTDDGMIVITLDNGQVWRQQDANVTLIVEPGDPVTVVRASMGTFRITDKRGRSARFKRMR
jgi:hypothetical protein